MLRGTSRYFGYAGYFRYAERGFAGSTFSAGTGLRPVPAEKEDKRKRGTSKYLGYAGYFRYAERGFAGVFLSRYGLATCT